ncbi:M14 family metallopeptidase [Rhodopirellula sallentina]|uniref:Zinc carboxypeptidase family protein n=1 Tax=Rhodopirellula sallentina SM41 TaxID=1263870 RepID=M5U793_9BACT|nr:M14-type cytosolic carboxypeptidase [Rhodopirellula sallentina]EMI51818.1 zinc carboxypeptidase family protein [Rhodopirellula sallentina SM41]
MRTRKIQPTRTLLLSSAMALLSVLAVNATYGFDPNYDSDGDQSAIRFVSEDRSVCIRSDFPGGRVNRCVQIGPNEFDLLIRPEQQPINDSAWYAFQVRATRPCELTIRLRYDGGTHRYAPLISRDGETWFPADRLVTAVHPFGKQAVLQVRVDSEPLWVSARQLLTNHTVDEWIEKIAKRDYVDDDVIGFSVENRPIRRLTISESRSPATIFLMARQHPTEITGMIGLMRFVEAISAQTDRASKFRKQFTTIVVPTANPDGVARGHWRCNASGVDLNRDWKHFTQPETQALRRELLSYRTAGRRSLYLFLDFHSTYEDVFYTAEDVDQAFPPNFTSAWLGALQRRFAWYNVNHDASHNSNRTTSKAWVRDTLDVAAVTYEFGDTTKPNEIAELANGSADEMMRLLVQRRTDHLQQQQQLVSTQPAPAQ